jgi:heme A synthase
MNYKPSLLLLLVLIAGLGGLNFLLLVPIAGLSSGTRIFSTTFFFVFAFLMEPDFDLAQ